MAVSTINVVVPLTGNGPAASIATLGRSKTVELTGRFLGRYVLFGSHNGSSYTPILEFESNGEESIRQTLDLAIFSVYLQSEATSPTGVTLNISGVTSGMNYFTTLGSLLPGATGLQPIIDLNTLFPPTGTEQDINFICTGAFEGLLVIQGSMNGVNFTPLASFRLDRQPPSLLGGLPTLRFSPVMTKDLVRYVQLDMRGMVSAPTTVTYGGNTPPLEGTPEQNQSLYQGIFAVNSGTLLPYATPLTDVMTFRTITPLLAPITFTLANARIGASSRAQVCANLATEINTLGTTAYIWSVNGALDGLIGTAKAPGIAFNSAPSGTALIGGIGSITTSGADPLVTETPNSGFIGFADVSVTPAVGTIVRSNGIAAQFTPAQANSIANASNILGIYVGGLEVLRSRGHSVVAFSGTPTLGNCYLSTTAGLATSTAPDGSMAPRLLGKTIKVTGATSAIVDINLDEDRDFSKPWLLHSFAPSVDSVFMDSPTILPGIYSGVDIYTENLGSTTEQLVYVILPQNASDGKAGGVAATTNPAAWTLDWVKGITLWIAQITAGDLGNGSMHLRKRVDGRFALEAEYSAMGAVTGKRSTFKGGGHIGGWATYFRLTTSGLTNGFFANSSKVKVYGVVNTL